MGKIRTRIVGDEEAEKEQKKKQKERSEAKKAEKSEGKKSKTSAKAVEAIKAAESRDDEVQEEKKTKSEETIEEVSQSESKKKTKVRVRGEKYKKAKKMVEKGKIYDLNAAFVLLKKMKYASFEESVELHINVEEIGHKGEVELPHSTGKTVRIKVVDDALLEKLENGVIDFDILVTHPSYMPKLAKYAKVLGPKGLMPNPKAGTVSPNPADVVKKFEKGALRWKTEPKFPLIHQMIGKASADDKAIIENASAFITSVGKSKIKAAFIKTSMSPSVKINIETI